MKHFAASIYIEEGTLTLMLDGEVVLRNRGQCRLPIDENKAHHVSWEVSGKPGTAYTVCISSPKEMEQHISNTIKIKPYDMSFKISLDEASKLIQNFINDHNEIATTTGLGGTLNKESIGAEKPGADSKKPASAGPYVYSGSLEWFCLNLNDNKDLPALFLSFEAYHQYRLGVPVKGPYQTTLMRPDKGNCFTYNASKYPDARSLLLNHSQPISDPDKPVSQNEVINLNNNYARSLALGPLNSHYYSFYETSTNNELTDLIQNPNVKYMRYYLGLSKESKYKNAKVRILLVPVDADGKNMVRDNDAVSALSTDEVYILQKSWPPDPDL